MNEQLDKLTFDEKRCSQRKHVIENDKCMCDCGRVIVGPTAAGNARVVTLLHGFEYNFTTQPMSEERRRELNNQYEIDCPRP